MPLVYEALYYMNNKAGDSMYALSLLVLVSVHR
jgi:hypothetical protein